MTNMITLNSIPPCCRRNAASLKTHAEKQIELWRNRYSTWSMKEYKTDYMRTKQLSGARKRIEFWRDIYGNPQAILDELNS